MGMGADGHTAQPITAVQGSSGVRHEGLPQYCLLPVNKSLKRQVALSRTLVRAQPANNFLARASRRQWADVKKADEPGARQSET